MAWKPKYQTLTPDRHNILWTSRISEQGIGGQGQSVVLYGLQYNGYAAVDPRNIAAAGWHLTTSADLDTLIYTNLGGPAVAGGKLKETGTVYWADPNVGATNEVGFFGRGAGRRSGVDGTFSYQRSLLMQWINEQYEGALRYWVLDNSSASAGAGSESYRWGLSIRLVKDSTTLTHGQTGTYTGNDGWIYPTICIGETTPQEWLACNLVETRYRNGDPIPEIRSAATWQTLTTGALCAYNNDWSTAYDYIESVTDLIGAGPEPLKFEFCNESDDPLDPIKSSRAILTVWSQAMFAFKEFYATEELTYYVEINQGTDLYWKGYVDPYQYQEQYGPVPYATQIFCQDGLSQLKAIAYDDNGTPYNGRKLESQIIMDILAKIGFSGFKEFLNIYEAGMNSGLGDSPLDQTMPDVDIFKDKYCDEVLKEILKKYAACIRQEGGTFCIYRIKELNQTVVYGRHFTGPITKTAITYQPKQYFKRLNYASPLLEVKTGALMAQRAVKKVTITQNYGNKDSWLDNYQFDGKKFTFISLILGYEAEYWIRSGAVQAEPVGNLIPGETEGVVISSQDTYPAHTRFLYQVFGQRAVATADDFILEFEYLYYNTGDTLQADVVFYIEIRDKAGTRWLHSQEAGRLSIGDAHWDTSQEYVRPVMDAPPGITDWIKYEKKIPGLPVAGPYQISIFSLDTYLPQIYVAIRNIKFFTYSNAVSQAAQTRMVPYRKKNFLGIFVRKQTEREIYYFPSVPKKIVNKDHVATNAINGIEIAFEALLGDGADLELDNALEQFAGALARATAQNRVDKITLSGNSGQCLLTCNGIGRYAIWNNSLTQTAADFVTAYAWLYLPGGIVLTSSGPDLYFTAASAGIEFYGDTTVSYQSDTLDGIVTLQTPAFALTPTATWNTRGGVENKALLQIIAEEIAQQYQRPKQFLDLPFMEVLQQATTLSLIGNFQDALNTVSGFLRAFTATRGTFDVKSRRWNLDLVEIGDGEAAGEETPITADTTLITADSTEITADQTHY